jgi:hypothetical protein
MNISDETKNIIDFLQEISENKLRKADDLALIIEVSASYDGFEELKKLAFVGSSIKNINSTIKRAQQNSDGIDKLFQELQNSLIEFQNLLSEYYTFLDEKSKKRIQDIYLEKSQGSYRNIIDFAHDLALFKDLQAKLKENKKTND